MSERPLVLLVDDFLDALDMYQTFLQFEGFRVITATTALEAIALVESERPDVVLMDAGLPGMDGWTAVQRLKSDVNTARIPVALFTGHVLGESEARSVAVGADAFITKPCLPNELADHVRRLVTRHHPSHRQ